MTETEETTDPPHPAPRRWDWQPKVRWFGAEFLVVVTGVLVALALNAWWGQRQDEAKERVYLRQLSADLAETGHLIASRDSFRYGVNLPAASQLVHSFGTVPKPPADSVLAWFNQAWRLGADRPVLGTVKALVATGELSLIRDDSLRSAILAYLDQNENWVQLQDDNYAIANEAGYQITERLDPSEAFAVTLPDSTRQKLSRDSPVGGLVPTGDWSAPFPLDVDAFYADRLLYSRVQELATALQDGVWMQERMRASAASLRAAVEHALED